MRISLNGKWQYSIDSIPSNDNDWEEMLIPANWYLRGLNFSGTIYFQKNFRLEEKPEDKEFWLSFRVVDYFAEVYLNGVLVGRHEGYFQPFMFNVTKVLKEDNTLLVKVSSPREERPIWPNYKKLIKGVLNHHDCRPGSWDQEHGQDYNTGGIWNDVDLLITNKVRISKVKVSPKIESERLARIIVDVEIENFGDPKEIIVDIEVEPANFPSKDKLIATRRVFLGKGKNREFFVQSIKRPEFWWTWDRGEPNLYYLDVIIRDGENVIDSVRERFGIREVVIDSGWNWYINGLRIFVRGTNIIPTQWLSEYTPEMIARDIRLLKDANVNAVRVHAHVNRDEFYSACDENGIMVWQDFALQWWYSRSDDFAGKAVSQIKDMVRTFYNHPSIVVWCCHNEPDLHQLRGLDKLLLTAASEEDATRYVDLGSTTEFHTYPGWYEEDYKKFSKLLAQPFCSEFGAQALPNVETMKRMMSMEDLWPPNWEKWAFHDFQYMQTFDIAKIRLGNSLEEFVSNSQNYQYKLLKYAIETYRRAKYNPVTGIFQFMFVDCWPAITWSVVDYYRQPKKGYYAVKTGYQPILVSIEVDEVVKTTDKGAIWIVNDLYESYTDAKLIYWLEDERGNKLNQKQATVNIEPDSVLKTKYMFEFKSNLPGKYIANAEIISKEGKLLSKNQEEIVLTR
ncbi:MAG: glycoside hydrolase family 2 TIM barrel-domain containing protein [Candidatus Jordarchaeaceae archaeon]